MVQALVRAEFSQPPRLWLVTCGAQPVTTTSSSVPGVAQSSLWGMGKVIALEHPELQCVRVDLDPDSVDDPSLDLFEEIWSPDVEDQVAFRQQTRYVARLARYQKEDSVVEHKLEIVGSAKYIDNTVEKLMQQPQAFCKDSTYLITGGTGSLGLLVARWMVSKGAQHLVLVGRSGASETVSHQLKEFEIAGANVIVAKADVSKLEQITRVLSEIEQSLPPLRGIIHAVGVLDDGVLQQQNWERFAKVMAPKVTGAWNLHTLTKHLPLDLFVMFSSIASLVGSPDQANYAAANAFLDGLAYHRRFAGLSGLSINWGAVTEVGLAAKHQTGQRIKAKGIGTINPQQVLEVLEEQLFRQSTVQVGVMPINWSQFNKQSANWSFFADFQQSSFESKQQHSEFIQQLKAIPINERHAYLTAYVSSQLLTVLGLNPSTTIDPQQGFFDLGMDSLTSVELRNRLQNSLGYSIRSTLAFDYPTVEALVNYLEEKVLSLEFSQKLGVELQDAQSKHLTNLTNLDELSEDEVGQLLEEQLANIERLIDSKAS